MGETVTFPSNGSTASGYLSTPETGAGPGVIVVQEWWGLVPQIKRVCDRLGAEGFTALAPDLFHGEAAAHTEVDKATELMQQLPLERAARDMSGAVDFLAGHEAVRGQGIGVVGFCMGGGLALMLATQRPDTIKAVVPYYGVIPWGDEAQPDWSKLEAPVQGHYGTEDGFFPPDQVRELEAQLVRMGKDVEMHMYPDGGHGFANDDRGDAYHEDHARQAWVRTLEFLRAHLG